MSNYYAPCFYRIDFVVISPYIELPCSNLLSLNKSNFPIIGLSEHKIGLNTPINNISLPGYAFCFDETKSAHGGTGFSINEKCSYTKRRDLNILLDKNFESTLIETTLQKKELSLWLHL